MERIRVLQIGAGGFGRSWLEIVNVHPKTELVGVVDLMPENLENAKQISNLSLSALYQNPDQAFGEVKADMVLIVTPPQTHKEMAIKAMEAGFHVLMEKPLTHTYEEAVELVRVSRSFDRKIAVSQNYRWRAPVQTVKKLLEEKAVGKVGYVEFEFRKAMKFGGWRDQYKEILLEDMAIHHFDMLRFLLDNEPTEIYAESFRPSWSWFSGNPSASAIIKFDGDIPVHYFGSWVSKGKETSWNGDIRIVGDQGAIEMIDDQVQLWESCDDKTPEGRSIPLVEMPQGDRASSLEDFVKAIRENSRPNTDAEDNFRSFELTCAAISSVQTGKKVKISTFSEI